MAARADCEIVTSYAHGLGEYCGLGIASEVFLTFTTQLYQYFSLCYLHYLVTSLKFSFLNIPIQQYFMLLTSVG